MRKGLQYSIVGFLLLSACASKNREAAEGALDGEMSKGASIQYQFAYEFFRAGDLIRALTSALKGAELAPQSADMHNLLGLIYFRQKEYEKAEVAFKKALELNPKLPEVYNNLGAMYYEQKSYAEARDILLKGLEFPLYLHPERIQNNLGLVYEGLGEFKKAEQAYISAIQTQSSYYLPYQNLGRMLLEKGDSERARFYLAEAVNLCSYCSEARYHLGNAYLQEKKTKEALEQFKAGHEADPKGYFGQLCQQFLVGDNSKAR